MKTKRRLKANPYGFYKIMNHLNNVENFDSEIDIKSLKTQFFEATEFDIYYDQVVDEIKRAILLVTGDDSTRPEDLENDKETSFSNLDLIAIQYEFEVIIRKRNKKGDITIDEIDHCKNVGECIELVISKL